VILTLKSCDIILFIVRVISVFGEIDDWISLYSHPTQHHRKASIVSNSTNVYLERHLETITVIARAVNLSKSAQNYPQIQRFLSSAETKRTIKHQSAALPSNSYKIRIETRILSLNISRRWIYVHSLRSRRHILRILAGVNVFIPTPRPQIPCSDGWRFAR